MKSEDVQRARDSLDRCLAGSGFFDRFYELFVASSPAVAAKFENTDFDRQKTMLQDSLYLMLVAAGTSKGPAHDELARIASRHAQSDRDIPPELYSLWLDCLMTAVAEHDPAFSKELDASWRGALAGGIEYIKSKYPS